MATAKAPLLSKKKKNKEITESSWLKTESMRQVMVSVVDSQATSFGFVTLLLVLLYGYAPTPLLLGWFGINVILSSLRFYYLRGYSKNSKATEFRQRVHYFKMYAYLAPFVGVIWGITVYLFNNTTSPNIAVFCLIVVVVYGMFSVANLSSHQLIMRWFVASYGSGLLLGVLLHIVFDQHMNPDATQLWFLAMVVVFVFMLLRVGERMNKSYIRALALQFRNRALIASLTEQRETALAAVATKNRMLASAAHDMRQPVLALDLYAGWLNEDPLSGPELAPKISASTKAVISLFDSMFDMSRLTEGQISTNLSAVNLKELVNTLYIQYQPMAWAKKLTLRTRTLEGEVFTDALLLERIVGNLLSNAIKYTLEGSILLACRNTEEGVRIEVWDTGVGIAPEQQSLVFREFYKGTANVGTTDGFGLGLSIVKQLTDLLGYELTLASRPGQGTRMSLLIGKLI